MFVFIKSFINQFFNKLKDVYIYYIASLQQFNLFTSTLLT